MNLVDVTGDFQFENPDNELMTVTKCACGAEFPRWDHTISIYKDDPTECPACHRKFYFEQTIKIIEVKP